jgi:hypothetical protein
MRHGSILPAAPLWWWLVADRPAEAAWTGEDELGGRGRVDGWWRVMIR